MSLHFEPENLHLTEMMSETSKASSGKVQDTRPLVSWQCELNLWSARIY